METVNIFLRLDANVSYGTRNIECSTVDLLLLYIYIFITMRFE